MCTDPAKIKPQTMRKYFRIIDEYVLNGYDAVKAYQSVYPNASVLTARQEFSKLKNIVPVKEHLQQREKEANDALGLSIERIYGEMSKMAFNADPEYPQTVKIKTLEVLLKNLKEDEGKTSDTLKILIGVEEDADNPEEEDI